MIFQNEVLDVAVVAVGGRVVAVLGPAGPLEGEPRDQDRPQRLPLRNG